MQLNSKFNCILLHIFFVQLCLKILQIEQKNTFFCSICKIIANIHLHYHSSSQEPSQLSLTSLSIWLNSLLTSSVGLTESYKTSVNIYLKQKKTIGCKISKVLYLYFARLCYLCAKARKYTALAVINIEASFIFLARLLLSLR